MRIALAALILTVGLTGFAGLTGCKSKQDAAIEQAKQQAASTGQAQQVVYTDKDGNTVTTTVQPPVAGQTGQIVTTVVTPKGTSPDSPPVQTADTTAPVAPVASTPAATSAPAPQPVATQLPPTVKPPAAVSTPVVRPVPPPPPDVHIAAGTALAVRIDQRISAKQSRPGDTFSGELVQPVAIGSEIVIPRGATVAGTVDTAQKRGNFKGAASLALSLTSITVRGRIYPLATSDVTRSEKGKGKRTGAFIGGGAGLGALIGGLAGGGKGALIGGLAGAGAGTAGAGLTGNGDLVIPAETVVRFELADDLVIRP
jgi:hypothetical protein